MRYLIFAFLLYGFSVSAQSVVLKGQVTDSLHQALAFANIMAESIHTQQAPAFALTDEQGNYALRLSKKQAYKVSVMYMGYETYVFKLDSLSGNLVKNIVLKPQKNTLDEVVIVADIPVKIKGDSIVYKTDHFKTGTERKLKDVLKKLPGVEIDPQGKVTVMGKAVSKVLVENKPFFGGGTKLAIDNIPADAVDKVEAIDDYNSIGFMKGLTDEQQMIINIKLKEGKKRFVFGDLTAGAGYPEYYNAKANLFYYSPKTNLGYIGNLNNTGESPMSIDDFLRLEGGISDFGKMKSVFKNFDLISNLIMPQEFTAKKDKFSALQWQQDFGAKFQFDTYVLGFDTYLNNRHTHISQLINQDLYYQENKTDEDINNRALTGKTHFRYRSSIHNYWDFNFMGRLFDKDFNEHIDNLLNGNNNTIDKYQSYLNKNFESDMAWHRKLNRHHTFRWLNNINYSRSHPLDNWLLSQKPLSNILPWQTDSLYRLTQNQIQEKTEWHSNLKHYWLINANQHIYTSLGWHLTRQNLDTESYQTTSAGTENNFDTAGFGNRLKLQLSDYFTGIQFKSKFLKGIVKIGVFAHWYHYRFSGDYQQDYTHFNWLPELSFERKFKYTRKLTFKYELQNSFPKLFDYTAHFYVKSFNSVYKGNPDIQAVLKHQFKLRFRDFSISKDYQYYINLNFSYLPENYKAKTFYYQTGIYRQMAMIDQATYQTSARLYYKRDFHRFFIKLAPIFSFAYNPQYFGNDLEKVENNYQLYKFATGTYFQKYPNIDVGIDAGFNQTGYQNRQANTEQYKPFVNISYRYKDAVFKMEVSHTYTKFSSGEPQNYTDAQFELHYQKENNPWGFTLQGKNLFNDQLINTTQYSGFFIQQNLQYRQGRLLMFKVYYKL